MNIFQKIAALKENKNTSSMEPKTSWNFEHNLIVYNMFSHLNHLNKLNSSSSDIKEFNEATFFLKYFSEKLNKNGITNQLFVLKNKQDDSLGLILDCGGQLWSVLGDLESVFQYLGVPKQERAQSSLTPYNEDIHKYYPINNANIKNNPELFNLEYPLKMPIQWNKVSYLNVKMQPYKVADNQKYYCEKQSFIIQSHKENLHEQKEFQQQPLNQLAQELIQSSDKVKMKIFELNIQGDEAIQLIDAVELNNRLTDVYNKIQEFKNKFQLQEKSKAWIDYIEQKTVAMTDTILEIKGEQHEFISENLNTYTPIVETHQKIQLQIENERQEQLFITFLRLALTLKKEAKFDNDSYFNFPIFKNHFLIHSKQYSYTYSLSSSDFECIQKNAKKTLITIESDKQLWYRLDEHPFFQHLPKMLNQSMLDDKLKSSHKISMKPKRF